MRGYSDASIVHKLKWRDPRQTRFYILCNEKVDHEKIPFRGDTYGGFREYKHRHWAYVNCPYCLEKGQNGHAKRRLKEIKEKKGIEADRIEAASFMSELRAI